MGKIGSQNIFVAHIATLEITQYYLETTIITHQKLVERHPRLKDDYEPLFTYYETIRNTLWTPMDVEMLRGFLHYAQLTELNDQEKETLLQIGNQALRNQ